MEVVKVTKATRNHSELTRRLCTMMHRRQKTPTHVEDEFGRFLHRRLTLQQRLIDVHLAEHPHKVVELLRADLGAP